MDELEIKTAMGMIPKAVKTQNFNRIIKKSNQNSGAAVWTLGK
jgi:hypothetical protein